MVANGDADQQIPAPHFIKIINSNALPFFLPLSILVHHDSSARGDAATRAPHDPHLDGDVGIRRVSSLGDVAVRWVDRDLGRRHDGPGKRPGHLLLLKHKQKTNTRINAKILEGKRYEKRKPEERRKTRQIK